MSTCPTTRITTHIYSRSTLIPVVFYRRSLIFGFHVDDFLVIGEQEEQDATFSEISQCFQMRDEGDVNS